MQMSMENMYQTGGVLYYMWMLPSNVMPYLLRLAALLMDSSIVHWICPFYHAISQTINKLTLKNTVK